MQIDDAETENPSLVSPIELKITNAPPSGVYQRGEDILWQVSLNRNNVDSVTFVMNGNTLIATDRDSTDGWSIEAPIPISGSVSIQAVASFTNGSRLISAPLNVGVAGQEVSVTEFLTFGEGTYSLDTLRAGLNIHTDIAFFNVTDFPAQYEGALAIRTPRADRNISQDTLISFQTSQPVTVLIAFDDSNEEPEWLKSYEKTSDTLFTTRTDLVLYKKLYTEPYVVLGGNKSSSDNFVRNMYAAFISPNVVTTNRELTSPVPAGFSLMQNYPNPFNPTTTISYSISQPGEVQLEVFNILGQNVRTLVDQRQQAGSYQVTFDASGLSSGMYMYRLTTQGSQLSKRMLLIK
jgi:hypothetical protein